MKCEQCSEVAVSGLRYCRACSRAIRNAIRAMPENKDGRFCHEFDEDSDEVDDQGIDGVSELEWLIDQMIEE